MITIGWLVPALAVGVPAIVAVPSPLSVNVTPAGSVPVSVSVVAFGAICTQAGCPVRYDQSNTQFVCPCHGAVYDARTGRVLQGPPSSPLPQIRVRVVDGQIRLDR